MTESLSRRTADRNALSAGARTLPRANAKLCPLQAGCLLSWMDGWMDGWMANTNTPHLTSQHPLRKLPCGGLFPRRSIRDGRILREQSLVCGKPLISHYVRPVARITPKHKGWTPTPDIVGRKMGQGACGGAQEINLTGREFEAPVLLRGTGVLTI